MNQERHEKQEIDTRQETDLGLTSSSAQTKERYTLAGPTHISRSIDIRLIQPIEWPII